VPTQKLKEDEFVSILCSSVGRGNSLKRGLLGSIFQERNANDKAWRVRGKLRFICLHDRESVKVPVGRVEVGPNFLSCIGTKTRKLGGCYTHTT
jgi:hypothetical protein